MTKSSNLITIRLSILLIVSFTMACGSNSDNTPTINSSVIMIGDSYFAVGDYIAKELETLSVGIYRQDYKGGAMRKSAGRVDLAGHAG